MNIKINTHGGGVFSKLNIAVDNLIYNLTDIELDSINNIYLGFDHTEKYCNGEINMFDYVFEQNSNLCFDKTINCATNFKYNPAYLNSVYSNKIKKVLCKLKIKTNILDKIPSYCNSNTLGVHIRLTDMLHCHPENCINRSYLAYEKLMLTIISEHNIKTPIFIASDNIESIEKLKLKFDILYIDTLYRNKTELDTDGSYLKKMINDMNTQRLWEESFIDCISLSKCGIILNSVSNFSNFSILFSNSIYKLYSI